MILKKIAANNRMQPDKIDRYAPNFAADARRYVACMPMTSVSPTHKLPEKIMRVV
jgi:hypothetical protein